RLSRKVLLGVGAAAAIGIGGTLLFALKPQHQTTGSELYNTNNRNTPDGLAALPKDYTGLPKSSPQLGPPLPGDLGKPILNAVSMPVEFSPKAPLENSPLRFGSITAIAAWGDDRGEVVEIEVDDGLKRLRRSTVAKAVGQGVGPGGILGLQGEQFGDGVTPALSSAASVRRLAIADRGRGLLGLVAATIAGLAFGVGQGVFALRLATSRHGAFSVT
ncbi:MAG TPA: hypothetical protein VGL58_02330, partial [Caulobacteraceae bacterium]